MKRVLHIALGLACLNLAAAPTPHVEGTWKERGPDNAFWILRTYGNDGTCTDVIYTHDPDVNGPPGKNLGRDPYRIVHGRVVTGSLAPDGTFPQEGAGFAVTVDATGEVTAIDDWTRVPTPATRPAK